MWCDNSVVEVPVDSVNALFLSKPIKHVTSLCFVLMWVLSGLFFIINCTYCHM